MGKEEKGDTEMECRDREGWRNGWTGTENRDWKPDKEKCYGQTDRKKTGEEGVRCGVSRKCRRRKGRKREEGRETKVLSLAIQREGWREEDKRRKQQSKV